MDRLSNTQLSVLPSKFEGLGLSALESMAAGVPTMTSDFPAAREFIIPGMNGHTFPSGDSENLKNLIVWHINNPTCSKSIGDAGRRFIYKKFNGANSYNPYIDIFKQLECL